MNSELIKEIKEKGLFATTRKLQIEARRKLPVDISNIYAKRYADQQPKSRFSGGGMAIGDDNRPHRIKNSDPSIHRNSSKPVNPLSVATIESRELDEPEVGLATELSLAEPTITAGDETPTLDDLEPETDEVASEKEPQEEEASEGVA